MSQVNPANPLNGTPPPAKQKDDCCDCCYDLLEMRKQYSERHDRRAQISDAVLQISNQALTDARDNANLQSKVFLQQYTQPTLNEASAAADLKNATAPQNAQSNAIASGLMGLVQTLTAMMANLANSTPSSPGAASQQGKETVVVGAPGTTVQKV